MAVEDDGSLKDSEPVTLEFDDGSTHVLELEGMTMGKIRTHTAARLTQHVLWEKEHTVTHQRIWAAQIVDRKLLVSTYGQGRQMLQVRVDLFGNLPDLQPAPVANDHEAVAKAMALLQPLLQDFVDDNMKDKHELKKARDEALKKLGLSG